MLSRVAYFFCLGLMLYSGFIFYPRWEQPRDNAAIAWDVSGYYWYLPSVFIYKDLKHCEFKDSILQKYQPGGTDFQQGMKAANGNYVMKYSSGMAIMYLPFFTAAHLVAVALGYPRDGFSAPYQFAIDFGGFLISLIGLWFFRRLLKFYYDDKVVATILVLLVFGSNYLNWAAIDTGMSHCWLFTVYVFLLLNTHYYYTTYKFKNAIAIGLLIGLATLTRPTEIISCLIPLLWGMEGISLTAVRQRIIFWIKHIRPLFLAAICACAVIFIQCCYWKYASGHWLFYSYGDQKFSWLHPHILDYTFSFRSGWLVYSPMLFFSFIGIIPFIKKGKNKVAILVFFLLNYYIVCSWDIWWFGGRAMIQSYPVLLFPMAALVQEIYRKKWLKIIFIPVCCIFLYFNIWITYHYHKGSMYDTDCMTYRYFWRVVGRWHVPENTVILRDNAELFEGTPKNEQLIYENNFEKDTGVSFTIKANGTHALVVDKDHPYSPVYAFAYYGNGGKWLRVQATFHCEEKEWNVWKMTQFIAELYNKGEKVSGHFVRVYRLLNNGQTKDIYFDFKLYHTHFDTVKISFWNGDGGDKRITISNLRAWSFQ